MILHTLQNRLKTLNTQALQTLSQAMGYNHFDRFTKRLELLYSCKSLNEYLDNSTYDMLYSSKGFLRALVEVLHLSLDELEDDIKAYESYQEEIASIERGYIYIDTHFTRQNQPIFALALCESQRRLRLDAKTLAFEPLATQLEKVSQTIKEHYKSSQGKIGIWGAIQNYILYLKGYEYIFDKEGKVQPSHTQPTNQSKATLRV